MASRALWHPWWEYVRQHGARGWPHFVFVCAGSERFFFFFFNLILILICKTEVGKGHSRQSLEWFSDTKMSASFPTTRWHHHLGSVTRPPLSFRALLSLLSTLTVPEKKKKTEKRTKSSLWNVLHFCKCSKQLSCATSAPFWATLKWHLWQCAQPGVNLAPFCSVKVLQESSPLIYIHLTRFVLQLNDRLPQSVQYVQIKAVDAPSGPALSPQASSWAVPGPVKCPPYMSAVATVTDFRSVVLSDTHNESMPRTQRLMRMFAELQWGGHRIILDSHGLIQQ